MPEGEFRWSVSYEPEARKAVPHAMSIEMISSFKDQTVYHCSREMVMAGTAIAFFQLHIGQILSCKDR